MEKNCRRLIKKNIEQKKQLKENKIDYKSNGKAMIVGLIIVELIKKALYKMSQYFPKPYGGFGGNINVKFICLIMQ